MDPDLEPAKDEPTKKEIARRRLLRAGGAALAGAVGVGMASAMNASPALAAAGDAVLAGNPNDAGTSTTSLTSSDTAGATLELSNTALSTGTAYAPLRLVPADALSTDLAGAVGSLAVSPYGDLFYIADNGNGGTYLSLVNTTFNSTQVVSLPNPVRALDTRFSTSRTRIRNAGSCLDSYGRLVGGKTMHLDLSDLVSYGDGVFGNVTITGATGHGYVTVFPWGMPMPATSTVNYNANVNIANFCVCGLAGDSTVTTITDGVYIYAQSTTHVIFDITAFNVFSYADVKTNMPAAAQGMQPRTRRRRG